MKKVADRSCPKTPNLEACSEELVLKLSQDEDEERDDNPGGHLSCDFLVRTLIETPEYIRLVYDQNRQPLKPPKDFG